MQSRVPHVQLTWPSQRASRHLSTAHDEVVRQAARRTELWDCRGLWVGEAVMSNYGGIPTVFTCAAGEKRSLVDERAKLMKFEVVPLM